MIADKLINRERKKLKNISNELPRRSKSQLITRSYGCGVKINGFFCL